MDLSSNSLNRIHGKAHGDGSDRGGYNPYP